MKSIKDPVIDCQLSTFPLDFQQVLLVFVFFKYSFLWDYRLQQK